VRRSVVPAVVLTVAAVLLGLGGFAGLSVGLAMALIGIGTVALVVGVGMVAGRLVPPLVPLVGSPARRAGGPSGRLADRNAVRNPARTATTAAALMIGLALVTVVAALGAGLRASDRQAISTAVQAPFVVTADNGFDTI